MMDAGGRLASRKPHSRFPPRRWTWPVQLLVALVFIVIIIMLSFWFRVGLARPFNFPFRRSDAGKAKPADDIGEELADEEVAPGMIPRSWEYPFPPSLAEAMQTGFPPTHHDLLFQLLEDYHQGNRGMDPFYDPVPWEKLKSSQTPNILMCLADDLSYQHTSLTSGSVRTPVLERLVREGVSFTRAYVDSPSCTPSRGAMLTGRHAFELGPGAALGGTLSGDFPSFPDILEFKADYLSAFTGKGWGPGGYLAGRFRNPAGSCYNMVEHQKQDVVEGLSVIDYMTNFQQFLTLRERVSQLQGRQRPFFFMLGSQEPHRPYGFDEGYSQGFKPEQVEVPPFLPDTPCIRRDLANYYYETEVFDNTCGRFIDEIESRGELENTVVIMASDNGFPFLFGKSWMFEYGLRVPLAFRWGKQWHPGLVVNDLVNLMDLAPTIVELAGLSPREFDMTGRSLVPVLQSTPQNVDAETGLIDPLRDRIIVGLEQHGVGQIAPSRGIIWGNYSYIWNFETHDAVVREDKKLPKYPNPSLWLDDKMSVCTRGGHIGYLWKFRHHPSIAPFMDRYLAPPPQAELYDVVSDPYNMFNLLHVYKGVPEVTALSEFLHQQLLEELERLQDPRLLLSERYYVAKAIPPKGWQLTDPKTTGKWCASPFLIEWGCECPPLSSDHTDRVFCLVNGTYKEAEVLAPD